MIGVLSVLALAAGALHIRADYAGRLGQTYVFKPLTTGLLIAIALLVAPAEPGYRALVVAGLACSLAGDVFLMLPSDRFRQGLASFLAAHLFYVAAFSRTAGFDTAPATLLPFALPAAVVFALLWPRLGAMRIPAAAYLLAIVVMGWQAAAQWLAVREGWALLALLGAVLFVVSDTLLAWNRFHTRFFAAQLLVLGTYYPAQWLIALSVGRATG